MVSELFQKFTFANLCKPIHDVIIIPHFSYPLNLETVGRKKTSLTSRDTCKESQNSSQIKTYSVGLNHDAELLCKKNKVKRSSHTGVILYKRIKQSDWWREFWGQNSRARLLNWMPTHIHKISIIAQFSLDILQRWLLLSGFPQKNKIKIPGLSRTIFLIFQDIYL